ncbi:MAG: hypothetical protein KDC44_08100 [Phaeodactylibacter sp.]|nr:hypothetical protein [Phaeodactylibacter sp.]
MHLALFIMNRARLLLVGTFLFLAVGTALAKFGSANLADPYTPDIVLAGQDTIPITPRYGDYITDPGQNPFDLKDPANVTQEVEYDPETGNYINTERIGEEYFRPPTYMTFEEYMNYRAKQQEQAYFD